jgi:putative transposase
VVPGLPHHVTQRGNNRQDVFFVDDDRRAYLKLLAEQSARYGLSILGLCLMDNHVHLIAIPARPDSLAKAVGRTHWLYAQYVNRLHGRSGHLWQNRFHSSPMDAQHCLLAMRHVERNPLRAGLCRIARRYGWSSAAAHCGGGDPWGVLDLAGWRELSGGLDWESALEEPVEPRDLGRIRRAMRTGRPLAGDRFLSNLERRLGRRLRPLKVGRPRRAKPPKVPPGRPKSMGNR